MLRAAFVLIPILSFALAGCDADESPTRPVARPEPAPSKAKAPEPPAQPDPAVVAAQVTALLGRLAVGDDLGGWRVREITGPADHGITIWLQRGDDTFPIWVVRRGAWEQRAPVHTEELDLFYGRLNDQPGEGTFAAEPLDALTARLNRTVPLPEGM